MWKLSAGAKSCQKGSGNDMSHALRSGAPRILGSHDGSRGRWFDAQYRALEAKYGPFDRFTKQYAAGVAANFVEFRGASEALHKAQVQRKVGKGRRPNQLAISRLQKRAGMSWQSYDQSLQRLEALCQRKPSPASPPTREELLNGVTR